MQWSEGLCGGGRATPGAKNDTNLCGLGAPCDTQPALFNWMIGTSKNTLLVLQYVAAYQWVKDYDTPEQAARWWRVDSSSKNWDNSQGAQDMSAGASEAWLRAYPGGASNWDKGFTPYGPDVQSVGAPGMLFVLQTKGGFNIDWTWYILQQWTINLGADNGNGCMNPSCDTDDTINCWQKNSGELDIIEVRGAHHGDSMSCLNTNVGQDPRQPGGCIVGAPRTYIKVFDKDDAIHTDSTLFAAVIDAAGATIYINPVWYKEEVQEIGLSSTQAAEKLQASPASADKIHYAKLEGGIVAACDDTQQLPSEDPLECSPDCARRQDFCPKANTAMFYP